MHAKHFKRHTMPAKRPDQWRRRRRLWKHRWREGDRLDRVDFHKRLRAEIATDRRCETGKRPTSYKLGPFEAGGARG
jgi:hypothetical protein